MGEPLPASKSVSAGVQDLTGTTVGRFVVRQRLGAGGMGEVYRADDPRLKRPVALKRVVPSLSSDPGYRRRFLKEAERASSLTHQHIASIYDVLEQNEEMFLVMEYVEGRTLRERLSAPVSEAECCTLAEQCAAALGAAHERGIVHHDIKPENIMLTPSGEVKILDFGVARQVPTAEKGATTATSSSVSSGFSGTPAYMAPEVLLEKPADGRADLFSLGVVLYEALAGRHPFRAGSFMATCDRILREAPPPLHQYRPDVSPEIDTLLARLLAKDPDKRYATGGELLEALRRLRTGSGPPLPRPAAPRRLPRIRLPKAAVAGAGAVVVLAVLAALPGVRDEIRKRFRPGGLPTTRQLVVLPFTAVSGDEKTQNLCDGLVETLTARLTQFSSRDFLQVISAHEMRAARVATLEQARAQFGVNLAVVGGYHVAGDQVRVSYSLVDPQSGRAIAGDTVTAPASDPFLVEDRVVNGLLAMLEVTPAPEELRRMARRGTQVAGAYDFYIQGRGYLLNFDRPENIENAISVFQKAVELDARFAPAHTGLGEAYWRKYGETHETRWLAPAQAACQRALELDDDLAAAHICLGRLFNSRGQYESAIQEFERALRDEPTSDDAYRGLAVAQEHVNQAGQAEQTYQRAIRLRPHYWASYNWLGAFYFRHGRYTDAAAQFEKVISLVPDSFQGYSNLGGAYFALGRYPEAIAMFERSISIRPTYFGLSNLATVYFQLRRFEDSARTFERATQLDDRDYVLWGNLGDAYFLAPGRRAAAAEALHRAIALAKEKYAVNPRDAYLLANMATYYAMLGDATAAQAWLREALREDPKDPRVLFKAARVHNHLGNPAAASDGLARALAAGYSAADVKENPFLDNLRSHPRYQALFPHP